MVIKKNDFSHFTQHMTMSGDVIYQHRVIEWTAPQWLIPINNLYLNNQISFEEIQALCKYLVESNIVKVRT
ncbi:hypothetical protein C6988_09660 [Nitrosopumilus sp. b1]|nr:hypothetical protein C6988_09660 [Nitrosopumilus sp. b1]